MQGCPIKVLCTHKTTRRRYGRILIYRYLCDCRIWGSSTCMLRKRWPIWRQPKCCLWPHKCKGLQRSFSLSLLGWHSPNRGSLWSNCKKLIRRTTCQPSLKAGMLRHPTERCLRLLAGLLSRTYTFFTGWGCYCRTLFLHWGQLAESMEDGMSQTDSRCLCCVSIALLINTISFCVGHIRIECNEWPIRFMLYDKRNNSFVVSISGWSFNTDLKLFYWNFNHQLQ